MIDVLGADHHGYVARMKAALAALGIGEDRFEVELMQLVNLLEGGQRAQMSKRRGEFATLDELIDDIGVDAARFFLVERSHETTLDLDLELARTPFERQPRLLRPVRPRPDHQPRPGRRRGGRRRRRRLDGRHRAGRAGADPAPARRFPPRSRGRRGIASRT